MKRNRMRNMFILAAVLIFAGAGLVAAHDQWSGPGPRGGYGGHMMGYGGHMMDYGGGPMMGYGGHMMGPGHGYADGADGGLSQEDYARLETTREKFFAETRDLRRQLDEKRYEMQSELARETPDRDKVMNIQSDISKLRSAFDEKALEHRLEVQELMPESAKGRGYYGGNRGGYCW